MQHVFRLFYCGLILFICNSKGLAMPTVSVAIDHKQTQVTAFVEHDDIYVALDAFCALVNAEAKTLESNGPLAVCRDDLCIPLNVSGETDTLEFEGVLFGRLAAFAEPLGLSWKLDAQVLRVNTGQKTEGLSIGQTPPAFTLPDLYSGEAVALSDYRGKKTVFYMWASW